MASSECRKFSPNIFNKSKCSNCFRLKEDHSASAIQLNKASRKISKCGYLFVAPDWDFSNPINRTKRWQRRWFVLYDDGELTYSVDDHPETIPQACIDMNKVMEVARADEVTGNPFSVAITAPERVHFVKGTCKEESNWWLEVLQIFPRSSIKTGRAKRNATFPGGIATTYITQYAANNTTATSAANAANAANTIQTPPVKCDNDRPVTVCPPSPHCDSSSSSMATDTTANSTTPRLEISTSIGQSTTANNTTTTNNDLLLTQAAFSPTERKRAGAGDTASPSTTHQPLTSTPKSEVAVGGRYKKIKSKTGGEGTTRAYRSLRSNTCENLSAIPQDYGRTRLSRYSNVDVTPSLEDNKKPSSTQSTPSPSPGPSPRLPTKKSVTTNTPSSSSSSATTSIMRDHSLVSARCPDEVVSSTSPASDTLSTSSSSSSSSSTPDEPVGGGSPLADLPVRGVPDGCGLEIVSPTPASGSGSTSIPIPSPHELLNLKKGWLMKQGLTKDWHKHWFVLQGSALMYFKDPVAENNGLMDGIIDLGLVQKVEERDVQRNYGFVVSTLDERDYILSAVTHGIRNNWINALKTAANLNSVPESDKAGGGMCRAGRLLAAGGDSIGLLKISRRNTADSISLPPTSSPRASPASYTGGELRSCSPRLRGDPTPAPVSPPLTRTPTSRVKKEKGGSSSKSGGQISRSVLATSSSHKTSMSSINGCESGLGTREEDETSMIPERDTPSSVTSSLAALPAEAGSPTVNRSFHLPDLKSGQVDSNAPLFITENHSESPSETREERSAAAKEAGHNLEISNLRSRLDNMNADLDAALKNLNLEQMRNGEYEKKMQDLEQTNSLLQIKSTNAEKSLREQSKEITSLNQRVREFSDLSTQYKAQVAENKTLRQKLEKMERLQNGPNWKNLYESLQEQHQKERILWEDKLKEMEQELQNMLETSNDVDQKTHIITDLSNQLQDSETRINQLICQSDTRERESCEFKEGCEVEIKRLKENIRELEEYIDKTDADKSAEDSNKDSEIMRLRKELLNKNNLEMQVDELEGELTKSKAQVEILEKKLVEVAAVEKEIVTGKSSRSRSLCSSRENIDRKLSMVRMDSLTDLMGYIDDPSLISDMDHDKLVMVYNDMVNRFNKAIQEIKLLKCSVKKAQSHTDEMEIKNLQLQQTIKNKDGQHSEESKLLTNKIEDLTAKYLAAEKQMRSMKLKVKGIDGKERRRSSLGIRPDEVLVNKEAEHVLEDIEQSLNNMESFVRGREVVSREGRRKSYETSTKASRARRKSSESSEISFVERLKKTEKGMADLSRKLSVHGDSQHGQLEALRKQVQFTLNKAREDLNSSDSLPTEVTAMLNCLETTLELIPNHGGDEEPGFPLCCPQDVSSHVDTVMAFLYRCVERVYEQRKAVSCTEVTAGRMGELYEVGSLVSGGAELARIVLSQETCLQAYLLLYLQHQVSNIETKFFAYSRDQTLKGYSDATKTLLLKLLEAKQFIPMSTYSSKKVKALAKLNLTTDTLGAMFQRIKKDAQSIFSRIGSLTSELMMVLTDAISCDVSEKESIVDGIRSEVFNLIEEDERMKEFQTSLINIFLISSDDQTGRDPERINLMANWDEALQSQAEVTRILVDQELLDFTSALEAKVEGSKEVACVAHKDVASVDNLSQCIFKIANLISQKCVTEAQITILNTVLGCDTSENEAEDDLNEEDVFEGGDNFVLNPDDMNSECNEFMLVLNNYRQQNQRSVSQSSRAQGSPKQQKLSTSSSSGGPQFSPSLESNLKSIRKENESKKARLSAALDSKRVAESNSSVPQEQKIQDLRVWCEKSMTAMEKSYENLLSELQSQHNREKINLRKEKDQALAEETQATLAALDAMRKAHESEVQKEVEKFKKEFLLDIQSRECIGALQSEFQVDREEIRREILSATAGNGGMEALDWDGGDGKPLPASRLTRSPSCPRLYSGLSLSAARAGLTGDSSSPTEPLKSPLTGMVANRKRVFETEY